jgi:polyprenyl-phospho-N-acetylgalactosaminyl synthase
MLTRREQNDFKLFIVIPCFNEQESIHPVVSSLLKAGYQNIILVDDHSTQDIQLALKGLPVFYIRHSINLGQGAALQTGFEYAKRQNADIVVTFDGDGQHSPADIASLIAPILNNTNDIVLGSRFLNASNSNISIPRTFVLKVGRYIDWMFTGLLLSDVHNGIRALGKKALQDISLTENGMAHATEIIMQIRKNKLRFCEIPVTINYSQYSRSKGQSLWNSINIFFDLIIKKIRP